MYSVRESLCFCKQKTAYEMRISDWSSDVCSSDLVVCGKAFVIQPKPFHDAGPKILQHHIRLQTQFARNGLAAIGLHVQSDRSFVAVGGIVGQAVTLVKRGPLSAKRIATPGDFHLDDLSAKIAQQLSAVGTCQYPRKIRHAYSRKRLVD